MTISGSASEENENFNYFNEKIINAKNKIKEFPLLNEIVNNFEGASRENCSNNFFLNLASSAVSDVFLEGNPSVSSEFRLKQFEQMLQEIFTKLKSKKKEELKSRLRTLERKNHIGKIIELNFYRDLSENDNVSEINYEDKTRGNHDFNILLGGIEFNIEVTRLGKNKIEEKLEDAFNLASIEILRTLDQNSSLKLEVLTDKLLENKETSSEDIKERIIHEYKKISPLVSVIKNNFCILPKQNLGDPEKSLYQILDYMPYYNEFGERIICLSKNELGLEFLHKVKIKEIQDNCFSCFYFNSAKTRLVNIHSRTMWPSIAEEKRKVSLMGQIRRRIKQKIEDGQLKRRKNGLIAFNFQDFLFHEYTNEKDIFAQRDFNELKILIQGIFVELQEKEILGVLLYENELKKSRFVENPLIDLTQEVIKKIDLLRY